jgi:hypothetical protein
MSVDYFIPSKDRVLSVSDRISIVMETHLPGAVTAEVARRYGVDAQYLYNWRHDVKTGKLVLPDEEGVPSFAEVSVEVDPFSPEQTDGVGEADYSGGSMLKGQALEIDFEQGLIRLPCDLPAPQLIAIIKGLR